MSACLSCGACCASFRVSFYWAETTEVILEGVPQELTDAIAPFYNCMKGTNHKQPRCIALQGTDIGYGSSGWRVGGESGKRP